MFIYSPVLNNEVFQVSHKRENPPPSLPASTEMTEHGTSRVHDVEESDSCRDGAEDVNGGVVGGSVGSTGYG